MKRIVAIALAVVFGLTGLVAAEALAADAGAGRMALPKSSTSGGMPLMEALAARSANRNFADAALSEQTLSNLLWATWGINRPDGRRTAPTAMNKQAVQVYAALENGVWLYDAAGNSLVLALEGDTRAAFGGAPLTLLYAVPADDPFGGMHAGALYQNAGLFCASEGLANVVKRTGADALDGKLPLPKGYKVVIIQSIGYPR
ncbi:MAG: nitroreductase family protein [Deltaproteobacteria bacterium]|nr:nitroreductase family protein [Deltaproteobacteria bacterium]